MQAFQTTIVGSLHIDLIIVPGAWSTTPPSNVYFQIDLDTPTKRIKQTVTFRLVGGTYFVDPPSSIPFSFLIKDKATTTIAVSIVNAGGSVTFQGSVWYQYIQNGC
jgi:hypothetical protein